MRNDTDQDGYVTVRSCRNQNPRNQDTPSLPNPNPNYWLKLPRDIIIMILQKVGVLDVFYSAQLVCTQWREICTDPSMWATNRVVDWFSYWTEDLTITSDEYSTLVENINLDISWELDQSRGSLFYLDLDIRRAVEQSCGIFYEFMPREQLHNVVKRSNRIRRLLGVPRCFIEAVLGRIASKLPLLESFELVGICSTLSSGAIETLGRYCPKLTSLKIRVYGDEEAKTIARSMPQLRHIFFHGENLMTDVGVEALLDGCPHLESLNIRKCFFSELTTAFQMMETPLTRTQWRDALDNPSIWSTICVEMWKFFKSFLNHEEFNVIIRRAVDKSLGGLVDLNLGRYMSRDILSYVVQRCTQIRRLHGHMSVSCSEEAIRAALARLPLLEDLALYYFRILSVETIETLGRCCPRITKLEIGIDNDGAMIIARSLPQLRYLGPLNAYGLTDVGVETLLDGCPHLEYLNLGIRLSETLHTRCCEQIKLFWTPCWSFCRPTKSYEYDLGYDQFFEEDVYDVNYTIHRREECWSRRDKARSKETRIQQRRIAKSNKNQPNTLRDQKARRRRDFMTNSRREVKKEFVYWNKIATDPCILYKMI